MAVFCITQVFSLVCWILVPTVSPVLMDKAGASSTTIGWILGTLPQTINFILVPFFCIYSDRTRTRFGRRIPYLAVFAPLICLALLGIGASNGNLVTLSVALVFFALASVVPMSLVFCLVPDAVPPTFIGRFLAWNGAACSLIAACFNAWCLAWTTKHPASAMYLAAGIFAAGSCLLALVRERDYPPEKVQRQGGAAEKILKDILDYLRLCVQDRFFVLLFLCMGLNQASMILRTMFGILFATKGLEIPVESYGTISGCCALLGALTAVIVGWRIDKTHPLRAYSIGSLLVIIISLGAYFFARSLVTYAVISVLTCIIYSIQSTAYTPLLIKFFPPEKYGQYSSANSTISTLFVMLGSAVGGWLTGLLGYRFIFLWDFLFTFLATVCLALAIKCKKDR